MFVGWKDIGVEFCSFYDFVNNFLVFPFSFILFGFSVVKWKCALILVELVRPSRCKARALYI